MRDAIQGKKTVEIGQCCSILSVIHINFFGLKQHTGPPGDYQALTFLSSLNLFISATYYTARLSDSTHSNK